MRSAGLNLGSFLSFKQAQTFQNNNLAYGFYGHLGAWFWSQLPDLGWHSLMMIFDESWPFQKALTVLLN